MILMAATGLMAPESQKALPSHAITETGLGGFSGASAAVKVAPESVPAS